MFAFATMILFSVTGLTLNHPDWFGGHDASTADLTGKVDASLLGDASRDPDGNTIDRDALVRELVQVHGIRGTVTDVRCDDRECTITWKAPGYAADAIVDRRSGASSIAVTRHGFMAVINDLHKGRDAGKVWSFVIDATAILLVAVAVTGFVLIFFIRRRRTSGLLLAALGTAALVAAAARILP